MFLLSGLSFDRPKKPHREKILPTQDDKNKYLEEAKKFAKTIADDINDPDGKTMSRLGSLCLATQVAQKLSK